MQIGLVTPARLDQTGGNRTTAQRWADFLSHAYGPVVTLLNEYRDQNVDLLIALHAWRSAASIRRFRQTKPHAPLAVVLTGTDVYKFLETDPETTLESLQHADQIVGLHQYVGTAIPPAFRQKLRIVFQSAPAPQCRSTPDPEHFECALIAHLREEKDPLRPAYAVRRLPDSSAIRITHVGRAYSDDWEKAAREEMRINPRYRWLGEKDRDDVDALLTRAQALIVPSIMEGGANVVSEAVRARVPILASDIPGNRGLLGDDYEGYFPAHDTQALCALLERFEQDPAYRATLDTQGREREPQFRPEAEAEALKRLVHEMTA